MSEVIYNGTRLSDGALKAITSGDNKQIIAHIASLQAEVVELRFNCKGKDGQMRDMATEITRLKAEVERLNKALMDTPDIAHNAVHDAVYEKGECDRIKREVVDAVGIFVAGQLTKQAPAAAPEKCEVTT